MDLTFHLEIFNGPLDLLLNLLAKNKVNIFDIPISLILQQYMDYIRRMEAMDMTVAAEFIAMASQLAYIKSRMLLPKAEPDDEPDPRASLVEALLEYSRVKEAGRHLAELNEYGKDLYVKIPESLEKDKTFQGRIAPEKLIAAIRDIFERNERALPPPISSFTGIVGHEAVPVGEKIEWIIGLFLSRDAVSFKELVLSAKSRSEIVAIFLAVLELSKDKRMLICEDGDEYTLTLGISADCPVAL